MSPAAIWPWLWKRQVTKHLISRRMMVPRLARLSPRMRSGCCLYCSCCCTILTKLHPSPSCTFAAPWAGWEASKAEQVVTDLGFELVEVERVTAAGYCRLQG